MDLEPDSEEEPDQADPRQEENWKIQKRKGFQKDRESMIKSSKISKTKERNSTKPLIPTESSKIPDHDPEQAENFLDFLN